LILNWIAIGCVTLLCPIHATVVVHGKTHQQHAILNKISRWIFFSSEMMNRGGEFVETSAFFWVGDYCIMLENQFNLCVGMNSDEVFFWGGG